MGRCEQGYKECTTVIEHETVAASSRPYAPSWIDAVTARVRQLPLPALAVYLGMCAIAALLGHLSVWTVGLVPRGALDPRALLLGFWISYPFLFIHHLDDATARAFASFRPALEITDTEAVRLHYELTTLPAWPVLFVNVIGLISTWIGVRLSAELTQRYFTATLTIIVVMGLTYFGWAITATMVYYTLRQMRLVTYLYKKVRRVDLFDPDPLYTFSTVTARTGIGWVFFLYGTIAILPELLRNPLWVATTAAVIALSIASFLWPLIGIHQRIVAEKDRLEGEANEHLKLCLAQLHRRVQTNDLSDADALNKQIASLIMEREVLEKMPTWPWEPGTLRTFLSALFLPIVVWLLQVVVQQLLGL